MLSQISVVLPSLDPDEKLYSVIDALTEQGFSDIILVNDGSKPEKTEYFTHAALAWPCVTVLTHPVNRGKGAAMKTAFAYILENRPDCAGVVTVDGDGQHRADDTRKCVEKMLESGHIVLGVRDFSQQDVPPRSRFGNTCTSVVFKIFVGMTISDTQTGLRVIPARYLRAMAAVAGERYEYETNMLLEMKKQGIAFNEVKIQTVYIDENQTSHFHPIRDSWRIYKLILAHFFRYTLSSMLSSVLELALYSVLSLLLCRVLEDPAMTAVTTVCSRAISCTFNFTINKRLVFHSTASTRRSFGRYLMLAIPQMLVQMVLTQGAYWLLAIPETATALRTVVYTAVMLILFVASYMIQQRWVFAPPSGADTGR